MTQTAALISALQFNRGRTLGLLDNIAKEADPRAILGFRPGPGRAHIGWQLMHIAITEEVFATERLAPEEPRPFAELWPRYRGGSTPDENIPTVEEIRSTLAATREHLLSVLARYGDERLAEMPETLKDRKWSVRDVYQVILWHEAHHQGQSHITLNLWKHRG